MKKKLLNFLVILLLLGSTAYAQSRRISGTVTNAEDGLPLPGVSVKIQGTNIGTQTSANGEYTISIPSASATLVFSYVGSTTQVARVGNTNVLNIKMTADPKLLSEVTVVVPYGTVKKEAITGSVATIGSRDIEKRTVTNITSVLSGSAPGISVTASNGQPGNSSGIRIRGFGSFSASNSPLIVLDGAPYDGNLGDINPNDIDNLSILKDASSSALYGSRASNGVVMITTKRGKSATPTVSATFNQGYSTRGIPEYDRLDAYQYYPAVWQAIKNNLMYSASPALSESAAATQASATVASNLVYNPFSVPGNQLVGTDGKLNPNAKLLYNDFDWYAPLQRTGKRTDAVISTSGRTDKTDYYVSLGYLNDKGYILKSDFKRFNARVNVNTKIKSWLKTGLNLSGATSDGNVASDDATGNGQSFINPFLFARSIGPIYPVHAFDASGKPVINTASGEQWYDYGGHPGGIARPSGASPGRNVVDETLLNDNLYRRNLISARSYVEVKFLKDFTFTPSISIDLRDNNGNQFQNGIVGDGAGVNGSSTASNNTTKSFTFNQILTYNKSIGKNNISALIAHENYDYTYRTF